MLSSMEQLPLNFDVDTEETQPPKPEAVPIDVTVLNHNEIISLLPSLSREALLVGYHTWIGKDPRLRSLSDEQLRQGIRDPEAEIARLRVIDMAADKEDLKSTHRR